MLRSALPQAPAKKRGAGGHRSLVGHLLARFKIREKRIRGIAAGRHRVFPVTRNRYPSIPKGNGSCAMKKTPDARYRPSKMSNAFLGGFMRTRIPTAIA